MMRLFLTLLFFCAVAVFPYLSYSEDLIFYRMAHNEGTVSFFNFNAPLAHPMMREIALRTLRKPFYPDLVESEYYQLSITRGVLWQGAKVIQYDYAPLSADRFRHVLWVTEDLALVVKLEIYDNDNKLLYHAVRLSQHRASGNPVPVRNSSEQRKHYFGFTNQYTDNFLDGGMRMLFSDGLNRFSLFRAPVPEKAQSAAAMKTQDETDNKTSSKTENLIVYGNYVYNENRNGFRYTVVGTIPFENMAEMIAIIADRENTVKNSAAPEDTAQDNVSDKDADSSSDDISH